MDRLDLTPDTPEKEPWPGLEQLGIRLAQVLPDLDVTMPILVSGDWGSGKTTLLEVVKRRVNQREDQAGKKGSRGGHAVIFEAWRHESESSLLAAMVRAVWEGLDPQFRDDKKKATQFRSLWRKVFAAARAVAPSVLQVAQVPVLSTLFDAGFAIVDQQRSDPEPSGVPKELDRTPIEKLWTTLDEFIEALPNEFFRPLVILIDDLDRCSPTGAVALLDQIRMLVMHANQTENAGTRKLRFVVALDRTVLTQAIARKYHDISRFEGNRYLEKIFPLTFDLPRPDAAAIRGVVNRCLRSEGERRVALLDVCSGPLSKPIFANPRLVKRCINRLRLLLAFEAEQRATNGENQGEVSEVEKPTSINDDEFQRLVVLVEWLAATERWPMLRRLLSRRPVDFWHRVKLALAGGQSSEPVEQAVLELFEEPDLKHWLEGTLQGNVGELYAADSRLRRWGL